MDIRTRDYGAYKIIDVVGNVNRFKDAITLKSFINTLLENKVFNIALNLSGVTYMDSGALNVLIYARNVIENSNGKICIIEPNEYVRDVLEVVGLSHIMPIHETEETFKMVASA